MLSARGGVFFLGGLKMTLLPYRPDLPLFSFGGDGLIDFPAVRSFLIAFLVSFVVCSVLNRLFSK